MNWIQENGPTILLSVTTIVTVASAVAAATPSKKDDKYIGFLSRLIDLFALNVGHAKRGRK